METGLLKRFSAINILNYRIGYEYKGIGNGTKDA